MTVPVNDFYLLTTKVIFFVPCPIWIGLQKVLCLLFVVMNCEKSQTLFGLISAVIDREGAGLAVWKHLHRTAAGNILGITLAPQLKHRYNWATKTTLSL